MCSLKSSQLLLRGTYTISTQSHILSFLISCYLCNTSWHWKYVGHFMVIASHLPLAYVYCFQCAQFIIQADQTTLDPNRKHWTRPDPKAKPRKTNTNQNRSSENTPDHFQTTFSHIWLFFKFYCILGGVILFSTPPLRHSLLAFHHLLAISSFYGTSAPTIRSKQSSFNP